VFLQSGVAERRRQFVDIPSMEPINMNATAEPAA